MPKATAITGIYFDTSLPIGAEVLQGTSSCLGVILELTTEIPVPVARGMRSWVTLELVRVTILYHLWTESPQRVTPLVPRWYSRDQSFIGFIPKAIIVGSLILARLRAVVFAVISSGDYCLHTTHCNSRAGGGISSVQVGDGTLNTIRVTYSKVAHSES